MVKKVLSGAAKGVTMACALFSDRTADGRDAAPVLQKMRLELRFKVVLFYGKPPPLKRANCRIVGKGDGEAEGRR